jgi:hypothetical protein
MALEETRLLQQTHEEEGEVADEGVLWTFECHFREEEDLETDVGNGSMFVNYGWLQCCRALSHWLHT